MIILASTSPRRKEILNFFSINFKIVPSNFDEKTIKFVDNPKSYVSKIALMKATSLDKRYFNDIIIAADTIVYFNSKIYSKPNDIKEAKKMLNELSNSWHEVFTSVCIKHQNNIFSELECTKVLINPLTEEEIDKYLNSIKFLDKAGGYAIQNAGSIIIKEMIGCYYNAMGLPINTLRELLAKVGINLWDYLKTF